MHHVVPYESLGGYYSSREPFGADLRLRLVQGPKTGANAVEFRFAVIDLQTASIGVPPIDYPTAAFWRTSITKARRIGMIDPKSSPTPHRRALAEWRCTATVKLDQIMGPHPRELDGTLVRIARNTGSPIDDIRIRRGWAPRLLWLDDPADWVRLTDIVDPPPAPSTFPEIEAYNARLAATHDALGRPGDPYPPPSPWAADWREAGA